MSSDWWTSYHTHGLLMFLSFGVLFPLAILAVLLRDLITKATGMQSAWFQVHRAFNLLATVLAIVSFIFIVTRPGVDFLSESHGKFGFSTMCVMAANVFLGVVRPGKAAPNRGSWLTVHRFLAVGVVALSMLAITGGVREDPIIHSGGPDYSSGQVVHGVILGVLFLAAVPWRVYSTTEEEKKQFPDGAREPLSPKAEHADEKEDGGV